MAKKKIVPPSFNASSQLVRWINPEYCRGRNRFSSAAFERRIGEKYLSVNTLEVEMLPTIVNYFKKLLQNGTGKVMVVRHPISEYNLAAQTAGVSLMFDKPSNCFIFDHEGSRGAAYRHRPTDHSDSHSGVEFVNCFGDNDLAEKKFCRRMIKKRSTIY